MLSPVSPTGDAEEEEDEEEEDMSIDSLGLTLHDGASSSSSSFSDEEQMKMDGGGGSGEWGVREEDAISPAPMETRELGSQQGPEGPEPGSASGPEPDGETGEAGIQSQPSRVSWFTPHFPPNRWPCEGK